MCDALKRASRGVDHRGHPLLRLRAAGPEGGPAHADHRQAGRGPARVRRRHPRGVDGHARRRRSRASSTSPRTTSTPRRCSSRTSASNFPATDELVIVSPDAGGVERARAYSKRLEHRAGHRRQAAPAAQRLRGDEPDRRREGQGRGAHRRHGRHRRHAHPGGRGAEGARAPAGWSPTRCTRSSPGRR